MGRITRYSTERMLRLPIKTVSQTLAPQVRCFSTSSIKFSGHSKWSTIKHDKAKNDAEKNRVSNKFANAIAVAAKIGGPDPGANFRLATAIEQAAKNNVTKKVIEYAIKRGTGNTGDKSNVDSAVYEGIGPGGVAFVVESLTDNKARTISLIRSVFSKYGGSLSPTLFQFDRKGLIVIEKEEHEFDDVFEKFIDFGVEDIEDIEDGEVFEIITEPNDTSRIADLIKQDYKVKELGIVYIPKEDMLVEMSDEDVKEKYDKFIRGLEEISEVTDYYTNLKE